ncbi:MAG: DUF177 domain-containing protein [Alphaproteobacteria bacterium]|nr:DUF177 domain-containing protein [Alphaproteobacteria bacterium]MCZ6496032.1 DUF177 domain-containing protein [Alphaproteobacteria bacterium]MCZ6742349.1 DUF177 domain-containing protein [Alphaproteobacteria bacterium]MCZ6813739.1 DUF177 domain-containing protein [Alphaproteobacteria bacterium]MCZ6849746.1 DUF177 domain-containing protein [Alphaproteobacteria bacterium]
MPKPTDGKPPTPETKGAAMSEFSRLIAVEPGMGAGNEASAIEVEAGPEERAALAARFGLLSLDHLSAKGRLHVFDGGRSARLEASIAADVVQACVVTLEPVASHIEDRLAVSYTRRQTAGAEGGAAREVWVVHDGEEEPEPLTDTGIDLGEAVAECLGLALPPYPRAADADSALASLGDAIDDKERKSPFAALEKLNRK